MKIINNIIFYLILFFLPTQLGKHFWPDFSIVSGIRIDYLSPTIYFTDILIFLLLVVCLVEFLFKKEFKSLNCKKQKFKLNFKNILNFKCKFTIYYLLFTIILLFGVVLSKSPSAGFYGLLKFFEFLFFGVYVSRSIDNLRQFITISFIFSVGIILESSIAIAQFFNQSSLNGIFYFLGERAFTSQTPGIANASLNGELVLRPYGTFSHPNVLAAYLVIAMTMIVLCIKYYVSSIKKNLLYFSILMGSAALFLTMSRIAILLWLVVLGINFLKLFYFPQFFSSFSLKNLSSVISYFSFKKRIIFLLFFCLIILFLVLSPIRYRFLNFNKVDESIVKRQQLISQSINVFKKNPVFGVGINNYLVNATPLSQSKTFYLQPVHNIYLLILVQIGIFGFLFFLWFLYRTLKNLSSFTSHLSSSLLLIVLILGIFDHYFLTLQQGQLLFAFVFGLLWSKAKI